MKNSGTIFPRDASGVQVLMSFLQDGDGPMGQMRWVCRLAVLWFAVLGSISWGDIPPFPEGVDQPHPVEPLPQSTEVVKVINSVSYREQQQLEGEPDNVLAKIVIPRKVLLQLLSQQDVRPAAAPQPSESPIDGTIIAGLCLAAAMVAGGYAWKRTAHRRTTGGAAIVLAFLGVATSGFADLGPPLPRPGKPTQVIDNHPQASYKVVLETVEEDGPVQVSIRR